MLKTIKLFIPQLILLTIVVAFAAFLDIVIALKIRDLVDATVDGSLTNFKKDVMLIAAAFIVFFPSLILFNYIKSLFIKKTIQKMKKKYMIRVFNKNINEFQKENNSMYLSSLTNDYNLIEINFIESIINIINSLVNFAAGIILFAFVNPLILVVALGLLILNIIVSSFASKPLNKHNKQRSELFSSYTSYIKEVLFAFHIIKTNNLEDKVKADFLDKSEKVQHKGYVIDKISSFVFAIQNTNFSITFFSMIIIVGLMALDGLVTFGGVVLIVQSADKIVWPVHQFSESLPKLISVKSIFKRIEKTLVNQVDYHETKDFDGFNKSININNLKFSYEDNNILDNINMTFEKGKKYLIVGPSGGGKSTVLKLLRKYFLPEEGEILVDNVPLKDIKKEQYFAHIANIEQNVFLFEDTIRNNLALYKDYSDEEIYDAIDRSGLTDFINDLPEGLDSMIYDNGKNVSGGERSRLAIARGLLNKADIIFLDEAFASLDAEKAKSIEKSILDLQNVTIINVSHVVFKEHRDFYDDMFIIKNKSVYN